MSIGTVNELGRSQNGKPKAKIDGKWYFLGRCNPDGLNVGMKVEYEGDSFTTPSGKQLLGLKSWKAAPQSNGSGNASAVSDDAEMRFISNCVGSAITAGTIKDPIELTKWAVAAKGALQALKGKHAADPEFNDDLPENFYGNGQPPQPDPNEPNW